MNENVKQLFDKDSNSETRISNCEIHGEYESKSFEVFGGRVLWTQCPVCQEENTKQEEQEKRQNQLELESRQFENRMRGMGIPKRYWNITLNDFLPKPQQQKAFDKARKFVDDFDPDNSQVLILAGTIGTGKTRLASALIQSLGYGNYHRAVDIGRIIRSTYGTEESEIEAINYFVEMDLLVIDEVGVQHGTENESMLLTDIIDRRYAELKSTVIISNLDTKALANVFGERAWDRIKQDATYEPMTGESLRGTK